MSVFTNAPACRQLRAGVPFTGKQGLQHAVGISAESAGAKAIHMQVLTIPPGGRARAHKHAVERQIGGLSA